MPRTASEHPGDCDCGHLRNVVWCPCRLLRFARKLARRVFRHFLEHSHIFVPALLDIQYLKRSTGPLDFCGVLMALSSAFG
jgi:hypothetical protein